jgi:hypothetical protein
MAAVIALTAFMALATKYNDELLIHYVRAGRVRPQEPSEQDIAEHQVWDEQ